MSKIEKGDLARIVRPYEDLGLLDLYVSVVRQVGRHEEIKAKDGGVFYDPSPIRAWLVDAAHPGFPRAIAEECLQPIRGTTGNEQFVVEARKSSPRPKPATTKGDTITERGELA